MFEEKSESFPEFGFVHGVDHFFKESRPSPSKPESGSPPTAGRIDVGFLHRHDAGVNGWVPGREPVEKQRRKEVSAGLRCALSQRDPSGI